MLLTPTPRQADIIAFFAERRRDGESPPTHREVGIRFGIASPNGVSCHFKALLRKGWLISDPRKARAWRLSVDAINRLFGLTYIAVAAIPAGAGIVIRNGKAYPADLGDTTLSSDKVRLPTNIPFLPGGD